MSENKSDRVLEVANCNPEPHGTRERICPQCRSADLVGLGRVLADSMGIRRVYRCRQCATEFLMFYPDRRVGPGESAADGLRA